MMKSWEGKTILIADDDNTNFLLLNYIVKNAGGDVIKANNGKEAVEVISSGAKVDAILMDYQMPVLDGANAILHIRKINSDVPIIVISGYTLDEFRDMPEFNGYNETISKPIQVNNLIETLNKYIQHKRA